jgi:hypothetical protein
MPVHEMLGWPGVGESAHRRALSENDISDGSRWVVMLLGATSLSLMLVFCTRGCIAARMLDCCKKPYCSWNVNVNNAKELAVSRWKVASAAIAAQGEGQGDVSKSSLAKVVKLASMKAKLAKVTGQPVGPSGLSVDVGPNISPAEHRRKQAAAAVSQVAPFDGGRLSPADEDEDGASSEDEVPDAVANP